MAEHSLIEWTDATWNPITGCSVVSPGCTNCYAMKLAGSRMVHHPSRAGLTRATKAGPVWTGEVRFNREWLTLPLGWKKPRRIFVCAHGDLFAEGVPDEWIDQVFAVMALSPHHTFQVLTKRPERAVEYFGGGPGDGWRDRNGKISAVARELAQLELPEHWTAIGAGHTNHIWFGASAEDQRRWDERRGSLLKVGGWLGGAFLSAEPLLGALDLDFRWDHCDLCGGTGKLARWPYGKCHICGGRGQMLINGAPDRRGYHRLHWVIAGGESGPGARPMHPDWVRSLREQCAAAGVPFFFKQWGEWIDADSRLADLRRAGFIFRFRGAAWPGDQPLSFEAAAAFAEAGGFPFEHQSDGTSLLRVGKKAAGRLLDGELHDGFPT